MKKIKIAPQIISFGLILLSFIACDKDFATLESDIINSDNATNFDIISDKYEITTYTEALGPVQTNGLGLNTLGVFDDAYGRTSASFVTQLALERYAPDFGEEIQMDSVVLTIPYFSKVTEVNEEGVISYDLDSVIGREPIKLSLYESDYFIRDFNPNGEFSETQAYFSNKSASSSEMISDATLESEELAYINANGEVETGSYMLNINEDGYILTDVNELDEEGEATVLLRQTPAIRIKLDTSYWRNKIINKQGESVLSSDNNFSDYFRGIYFKAEANAQNEGSFLILNTANSNANITLYYTRLNESATDDEEEREQNTFKLNFVQNQINFIENDFTIEPSDGDAVNGDSRIYLKGGSGSLARIKLFNGDNIEDGDDTTFDDWKSFFVETEDGKFVKSKRLVNEANLVFYVDQDLVDGKEPNRIYLYDIENKTPLVDYYFDANISSLPSLSIRNHLGPLQRIDEEPNGAGVKYKLRITEHINDLLLLDSTNVELGLSVSLNVNLEEFALQRQVQSEDNPDLTAPVSSIISPRGTILHGNNTEDESKKVYLEIYYTEPNNY